MAKSKQVISIPMSKGLEQGDSPLLSAGLLRLENGVFKKDNQISKCTGMVPIGTATYDEDGMTTLGDRPVLFDRDRVLVHEGSDLASGSFVEKDSLYVARHTVKELGGTRKVANLGMAERGDVRCVVYTDSSSAGARTNHYKIYSIDTGLLLASGTNGADGIKVLDTGGRLLMLSRNGVTGKIEYSEVNTTTGAAASWTAIDETSGVQSDFMFDACPVTDEGTVLIAYKIAAEDAEVVTLESNGTVNGPTTIALISCREISCYKQKDGLAVVLCSDDTSGSSDFVVYAVAFAADATQDSSDTAWSDAADRPVALCGASLSDTTGVAYIGVYDSAGASNGTNDFRTHRVYIEADGAGSTTAGSGADWMHGSVPFSKPLIKDTSSHFLVLQPVDTTDDQNCFIVVRSDTNAGGDDLYGEVRARILPGFGGFPQAGLSGSEAPGEVVDVGDGVFRFAVTQKLSDEYSGAVLVELDLEPDSIMGIDAGDRVLVEGSVGSEFDGFDAYESGFLLYPKACNPVDDGTGATPAAGDYSYCVTWAFMDAKGCLHRSAPSSVADVTASGGQVDIAIPTTKLHRKAMDSAVIAEVWRTEESGSFFYRVGDVENDQDSASVTFEDTVADATLILNEALYKQPADSTLAFLSPQPWKVCCMHQQRHFIVDAEHPNTRVLYSNVKVPREGFQWSDVLCIDIPSDGGEIKALASYQDRLLIFKADSIYMVYGKGLDTSAYGSGYSYPARISSSIGCSSQKSIVECPAGLLFEARSGVWAVTEKLQVVPIGEGAEHFTENHSIRRGLLVPAREIVVFITDGNALVYHYMVGAWGEFTWDDGIDGCVAMDGNLCFSTSNGTAASHVMCEDRDLYTYYGAGYDMVIETSWIAPAKQAGWGRAYSVLVGGHAEETCTLRVKVAYDNIPYWKDDLSYDILANLPASGVDNQYGTGLASSYADDAMLVDFALSQQKLTSLRIYIADNASVVEQEWEDHFRTEELLEAWSVIEDEGTVSQESSLLILESSASAGDDPQWWEQELMG